MLQENCKSFLNNPQDKVEIGKEMYTSVAMSHTHYNMDKLETLDFVKSDTASVTVPKNLALVQQTINSFYKTNE